MWVLIIFIIILAYGAYINISSSNDEKKEIKKYGDNFITRFKNIQYIGGFKDISNSSCTVDILCDKIIFEYCMIKDVKCNIIHKIIKLQDIKDVYIESQMQLVNKIGIGKIICFGALGALSQNTTTAINEYVVINTNDDESIIIKTNNNMEFVNKINNLIAV